MDIDLFIRTFDNQTVFEVADAWDEYTSDANYQGYCDKLSALKAQAAKEGEEVRVLRINVPDEAIEAMFKPRTAPVKVLGEVNPPTPDADKE